MHGGPARKTPTPVDGFAAQLGRLDGMVEQTNLTPTERQVVDLTVAGLKPSQIAAEIGVKPPRITYLYSRALGKLKPTDIQTDNLEKGGRLVAALCS